MTIKIEDRVLAVGPEFATQEGHVIAIRQIYPGERIQWATHLAKVRLDSGEEVEVPLRAPEGPQGKEAGLLLLDFDEKPSEELLRERLGELRDRFWIAKSPRPAARPELFCKRCLRSVIYEEKTEAVGEFFLRGEDWYVSKPEVVACGSRLSCGCQDVDLAGLFPYTDAHGNELVPYEREE